ncbi:molybdopterin cofactor-binding domain-containing protein [Lutibacter sp.]|uniref:xanthine dehydrogenase family protein molybdopterin-binding subunit n=1 Tax=Lutibacter sp. TaxID=1925666 RepID=UPI001A29A1FB|nr:molybdopterin cofactor-binding domain-containing protein [Lutibacter sp.]MBI9040867.1 xanthine dehydrogenase family protein molybdopterin-binding subunit [Lutibacter sp.]
MRPDKINELYFSDVNEPVFYDRRKFLKTLGKGIIVIFSLSELSLLQGWSQTSNSGNELDFNAYIHIKEDGRVNCYTGKIEMGQGIITSLAQVVAEELEVSIQMVDMIMGDTELCPYDAGTWGSLTTRFADPVIRAAAAEARQILLKLASEKLQEPIENLVANNGVIYVQHSETIQITYAELTKGKKIVETLKNKPTIKKSADFEIIGKPIISTDAIAKVTGKAQYSGDIKLPGMVYATVVRPDVFGSKKISVNAAELSIFEGVELVEEGDLVAVLHSNPEVANKAARKVKVVWDAPKAEATDKTIFEHLNNTITDSKLFEEEGDLEAGKKASKTIVEAEYYDGYKAHAPMETHSATCYFEGDKLIMWASTQTPFGLREQLSKELNMALEKVHIKQIFLGGGFGGKIYNQQAIEAAIIAKSCHKPVQLVWSRREEFMYDNFRPAALMKAKAGVDENGKLQLWEFDIYCAGTRGTKLFYEVPNNKTSVFNEKNVSGNSHTNKSNSISVHPFKTGAWRAPGNNSTTFARESHLDVTAFKLGIDPLEFRLNNLKNKDMIATLNLAAETFNWKRAKKEGHGYGIALGEDAGTCVAIIAQVHVDKSTGIVTPIHIVCAQDMGQVVNPHGATVQTEGGVTMGLGYALYEDIEFTGGKLKAKNFNNYTITKFSVTPTITCAFIDKMDSKPQGGGEPAIICVGGAIANAVFDACGARVHQMPVTPERILKEINKVID